MYVHSIEKTEIDVSKFSSDILYTHIQLCTYILSELIEQRSESTNEVATISVLKDYNVINVTRSAKTRHNSAFLEIDIFASVCFMYLKLCSVLVSSQYCK